MDAIETPAGTNVIARALVSADDKIAQLKVEIEEVEKWRRLLESVETARTDAPALVCELLSKHAAALSERESHDPQTVTALRELYRNCSERATADARLAVRTVAEGLEAAGLEIDKTSRHPRYSLYDHAIELEVDERGLKASIEVRHGERTKMPLDIAPVVRRVKEEHDRLFAREWKPAPFLAAMKKAYKPLAKKGDKVPLRELAAAMSKPRKPRLDEFSVDLGRLLMDPLLETGSTKVNVDQTRDTKNGLLLHGLQHSGYVLTLTMEERA